MVGDDYINNKDYLHWSHNIIKTSWENLNLIPMKKMNKFKKYEFRK